MKRCKSISPVHELCCELNRNHTDNPRSLHKANDIVWGNDGRHRHGVPLLDLIRQSGWSSESLGIHPKQGNETTYMAVDEAKQHLAGRLTSAAHELAEWWRETAENEIEQTVSKAVEYGATDLVDIGRTLARVAGREIPDSEAAEWGIFFYLEGKLSRWRSAIERGDLPSFDTLLDIGVYARMAQRVRMTGGWPGTEDK